VARVGNRRGAERVLVGKHDKNISLGRQRSRKKDNIKMNLKKVEWGEWTGLP